jgi:hypothetical protein
MNSSAFFPLKPIDAVQRLNWFGVKYCSGISLTMFCMVPLLAAAEQGSEPSVNACVG